MKFITLLALLGLSSSIVSISTMSIADAGIVSYQKSDEDFPNPERGFYKSLEPIIESTDPLIEKPGDPLELSDLQKVRSNNMSVIRRYYLLSEFRNQPISQSYLDMISKDCETARRAGVKMIIRFTYNWLGGGADAPANTILSHLDQLKPILQENYDVIAYMEAGFIGNWGEWHSSTNKLINPDNGYITSDADKIFKKILSVLPKERMVALRYHFHKKELFNTSNALTPLEAYNGSDLARTGHHNDSFRANLNDWGTYTNSDSSIVEQEKAWLNLDTQWVVQGGEPSRPATDPPQYDDCPGALTDFARMHWSGMTVNANGGVSDPVYQGWREQGCLEEIKRRLGYRFRLIESTIPEGVKPGGIFSMSFKVTNDGWASPYNPRNLEIILRNRQTGNEYYLPVAESVRLWMPGETKEVKIEGGIPSGIPTGEYQVLMNLPDPAPSLSGRPEYSIRLANFDVWEADTGYNTLGQSVDINSNAAGDTYSGNQFFQPK